MRELLFSHKIHHHFVAVPDVLSPPDRHPISFNWYKMKCNKKSINFWLNKYFIQSYAYFHGSSFRNVLLLVSFLLLYKTKEFIPFSGRNSDSMPIEKYWWANVRIGNCISLIDEQRRETHERNQIHPNNFRYTIFIMCTFIFFCCCLFVGWGGESESEMEFDSENKIKSKT